MMDELFSLVESKVKQPKCQDCGRQDPTVRRRTCPYDEDVNDTKTWVTICDYCEGERAADI